MRYSSHGVFGLLHCPGQVYLRRSGVDFPCVVAIYQIRNTLHGSTEEVKGMGRGMLVVQSSV